MPSPVLHSLAGLALARFTRETPDRRGQLLLFGALVVAANLPDLDFLPGILAGGDARHFHRGISHSLIAVGAFTAAALGIAKWFEHEWWLRFGLLLGVAFTSHLLLDMLSSRVDQYSGVALAWPLSSVRLLSPIPVFIGISLDTRAPSFVEGLLHRHNLHAVVWELVVAGVIWAVVLVATRPR